MPRYFVTDPPVAVPEFNPATTASDQPPNVIYIRARMDVETRGKVMSELFTLDAGGTAVDARLGANETALLVHNIVRWEGPDLGGVPCTPETIRRLDPTEPHIARVLAEITRRNAPAASPNPKSPGGRPSTSGGAPVWSAGPRAAAGRPAPSATLISPSALPSASDGHPNRSDGSTPTTLTNSSPD